MGLVDLKYGILIAHSDDDLMHEMAHIISGHPKHNNEFNEIYYGLGGINKIIINKIIDRVLSKYWISANVGNVTGIQNILLDYHLLQAYRKFSQRVLATEGQWELKGDNKIRLFPTPRGGYPVVVQYLPVMNHFRSPIARELTKRALLAECKIILGNSRSKFSGIPSPDGGTLTMNGDAMRTEGQEEKKQVIEDAISYGEPMPIVIW
jgi:hypothetical protein